LIGLEEIFQNFRPVPFGIVQDKVYLPLSRFEEITDKIAKGLGIESGSLLCEETACFQIECPKEAHFVTNRRREHTRLLSLRGPHPYQAAVPLEMDLVLAPKLDGGVFHPSVEVFLKASCWSGSASLAWRRGLWRLNPSWWNSLWHCRTLNETE